jgi:acyl carrier protein
MQYADVLEKLKEYIAKEILDGRDIGLDASTPLLEWGVINSLEMRSLLLFIEKQFQVIVPPQRVVAETFQNLHTIATLVVESASNQS